ncbi:MAG: S-layer homology domain-containing protein [Actinobacteria bacterium]|nr:S-layer homology domain-containing protein [Actinomycetota bacterium]
MKKLFVVLMLIAAFLFALAGVSMAAVPKMFTAQEVQIWLDANEGALIDLAAAGLNQDSTYLILGFEAYGPIYVSDFSNGKHVSFYLDTDGNPSTGAIDLYNLFGMSPDYMVLFGGFEEHSTSTGWVMKALFGRISVAGDIDLVGVYPVVIGDTQKTAITMIPLSQLPTFSKINCVALANSIKLGTGEEFVDYLPNSGYVTYYASGQPSPTPTPTPGPTPMPEPTPTVNFSDVPANAWFKPYVDALVANSIVGGYPDNTFRPLNNITRAEFAKMIILAIGENPSTAPSSFTDVLNSHWAKAYIQRARELNIIGGYPDGTFRPNANVSRQEIAKMVVLAAKHQLTTSYRADFTDVPSTLWSWPYILTAKDFDVISGYPDKTFRPTNPATRAEACKMIYALLGQ